MGKKCSIGKSCGASCVTASYRCRRAITDAKTKAALSNLCTYIRSGNTGMGDLKEKYGEALDNEYLLGEGMYGKVYSYGENAIKVGEIYPYEIEVGALASELGIGPKIKEFSTEKWPDSMVVMEKVKGQRLGSSYGGENEEKIREGSSTPHIVEDPKEAGRITDSLISLRAKMHRAGISHGDCHCDNVMYDKETGVMKIIDWGRSKKKARPKEVLEEATLVIPWWIKDEIQTHRAMKVKSNNKSSEDLIASIRKVPDVKVLSSDPFFSVFTGLHSFRQLYDNSPNYQKLVENYVRFVGDDSPVNERLTRVTEALYEGIE